MTTITPSTRQVNEGDSLSTTLSGFTPNSTLFFSVTGRGINKKDFSAGAVKGSVRVDSNGVATISHTLRADKATEGEESFSVQVFSDKRMRNSLGQSDAVTVFDTSVKAPKVGKPPKDGGGVKEPTNPINPVPILDPPTPSPINGGGMPKVDAITGVWAEEGYFISGTGVDKDGPYEDEGPFGFFKTNKLLNGRFLFDQASYNPSDYSKERWILFDDVNANKELDSDDKVWGYVKLSKKALVLVQKGLDFPIPSDSENAGIWEARISAQSSTGKMFQAGFHLGDIQIVDPSVFG